MNYEAALEDAERYQVRDGACRIVFVGGCSGGGESLNLPADAGAERPVPLEQTIPPLPADWVSTCTGPVHGPGMGYQGQCCTHIVCRQPKDGVCPENEDGKSYGSGACGCAGEGPPITGPFAISPENEQHREAREKGPCCYVSRFISCTGRPLSIEESTRVAGVVVRSDWC